MEVFSDTPTYRQALANGGYAWRRSGNRMTADLMNEEPSAEKFAEKPEQTLKQLVVRALHRHVNDALFKTIDIVGTPDTDPNVHAVEGEVLTKAYMSRKFLHNSQRAYWDARASAWATGVAVPAAANAVRLALAGNRAIV